MSDPASGPDDPRPGLVLVDAYSTGAMLAREAARTHRLLHVRTRPRMPAAFASSLPRDLFEAELAWPGVPAPAAGDPVWAGLAAFAPQAVIAASEFGVEAADAIADRLGLRGNEPSRSSARRDKARMLAAVAGAGLRTPRQLHTGDLEEVLAWWRAAGSGPVVLKPVDSAGSDGVRVCRTAQDLADAFHAVVGRMNLMMRVNETVLVQEYLDGDEYVVNTVSRDGEHWVTDVWLCHKLCPDGTRKIYDHEDLLAPEAPVTGVVTGYVLDVLDALGVRDGPAHTELIVTTDGPCLLETGARVSGLADASALDRCTGADQVSLTLDAYSPHARHLAGRPRLYRRLEHARCVNLVARRRVPFLPEPLRDALAGRPAVHSLRLRVRPGDPTTPTVDLNTSPGVVFLIHPDPGEIEKTHRILREVEADLW